MANRSTAVILVAFLVVGLLLLGARYSLGPISSSGGGASSSASGGGGLAHLGSVKEYAQQLQLADRARCFTKPQVLYEHYPSLEQRKNIRVLVTGGAGFIGSQLAHRLHQKGFQVTLIDNMAYGYDDNLEIGGAKFGRFVLADVRDKAIFRFVEGMDFIFHFAALTALPVCQSDSLEAMDVNVAGTANILEAARLYGVRRVIFASTSAVYENNKEAVFTEELVVSPRLLYSLSKLQSEQLLEAYAETYEVEYVSLRFFNVYGPHQDFRRTSPPLTSYLVREILSARSPILHSDGMQKRDYIYVEDLLDMAVLVMEAAPARNEVFNVASGSAVSVNDIFRIIAEALDEKNAVPKYRNASLFWKRYPRLFDGVKKIKGAILEKEVNKYTLGSYAKAERLLGWKPRTTMEEGLRKMVAFVKHEQRSLQQKDKFAGGW